MQNRPLSKSTKSPRGRANAKRRKKAARVLPLIDERFRALTQATSNVVYSMSPDWKVMRYLEGRQFIADTREPNATWFDKYIHPDDQKLVERAINRAIANKSVFELEHRVIRTDGSFGWTYSRAIPILDARGDIVEWFGAASDISPLMAAERAFRVSEAKYRELFEAIDEGFCIIEVTK